ncbi:hypothetical protein VT52_024955 [Streptomyces malaysiense]|uniref:Uncharacterized protein n=1 Tax=Streptomyces malaysiense TaxID=1428626 RepID=A0A1J4PVB1_9ACTN|nr:hypothetical protein VT52_024955 [Streptomyces malaysiense]
MALAEAADTPRQRAGGTAGVVQGALVQRLAEDGGCVMSCCLCLGEHGGECVPSGVVEDALGVLRNHILKVVGEAALGLRAGCPAGEADQDGLGGPRVRGL